MNSETVKPMPASAAAADDVAHATPRGSVPEPEPDGERRTPSEMPIGLPATRPTTMPEVIGEPTASAERVAAEVDAGVGEREQRHDDVAGPRVQQLLQALVGRDRRARRRASPSAPCAGDGDWRKARVSTVGALDLAAPRRVGGDEQPEHHAGDRRVHAGLDHRHPERDAERRSRPAAPDAEPAEQARSRTTSRPRRRARRDRSAPSRRSR